MAVGSERQGGDCSAAARQCDEQLAGAEIEDAERAVVAARGHAAAIGTGDDVAEDTVSAGQPAQLLARGHVPQAHCAAPRNQHAAIGGERQ